MHDLQTSAPAVDRLLSARARRDTIRWQLLPKTAVLADKLRSLAVRSELQPLADALKAQHAAILKLHFELLVPVGLRASAPQHEQAAFLRQVKAVARGSEGTWLSVQELLRACAQWDPHQTHALSEFSGALKDLERQAGEARQLADGALADIHRQHAAASGEVGRQGYATLASKVAAVASDLEAVQSCCAQARAVQDTATTMTDAREALMMILRRQVLGLVPSMLSHLARVLAPPPDERAENLGQAQVATRELADSIDCALMQLAALAAYGRQVAAAAESLQTAVRAVRQRKRP